MVERGGAPVLLVPDAARRAVREALARQFPEVVVLADSEAIDENRLEIFATIGSEGSVQAA